MWLYLIALLLLIGGIAGTVASGGIFTIVLIPVAVIVLVGGIAFRGMGAISQRREGGGVDGPPLPHSEPDKPGHVRTSPEALADARRAEQ
ncbi:MAG: hypothetical protein M3Z27_08615 [Actinomycetota bacterium]|nr:hypothetical protein [Actinomycetota bacterium]